MLWLIVWFMLTISIKAYCKNTVVNIKPIYLKSACFCVPLYNYQGKISSSVVKKMFIESETQESLSCKRWHLDNCPPRKIAPQLGLRFWSRLGLVLGLGATRQLPQKKIVSWLGLGFGFWVSFGIGGNLLWGQLS